MLRAIEIMRANHPENHTNVTFERSMLTRLYVKMNRLDDAERVIDDVLKQYFLSDPSTYQISLTARVLRANVLVEQSRLTEAAAIHATVFELREGMEGLDGYQVKKYAKEYSTFLARIGEPVAVEELEARLRID